VLSVPLAIVIQHHVEFHIALASAVTRPIENLRVDRDRRRVQDQEPIFGVELLTAQLQHLVAGTLIEALDDHPVRLSRQVPMGID